jgi:HEAT repeat protein
MLAAAVAAASSACRQQVREPHYDRRPLSEWARDLGDRSEDVSSSAVRALFSSGDDGVPFALEALEDPDWLARRNALRAAFSLSGRDPARAVDAMALRLEDPDPRVREEAASKLHEMVMAAQEARLRQAGDEGAQGPYVIEYSETTPLPDWSEVRAALPRLAAALKDSHEQVRYHAAWALARSGPEAAAAGPLLEGLLDDPSLDVRLAAAVALVQGGSERSREVVPVALFLEALAEERRDELPPQHQYQVPLAVAALGPKAREAVPILARIAGGHSTPATLDLRLGSIVALGNFGPLAKEAIPALEEASTDSSCQAAARAALARIRGE